MEEPKTPLGDWRIEEKIVLEAIDKRKAADIVMYSAVSVLAIAVANALIQL